MTVDGKVAHETKLWAYGVGIWVTVGLKSGGEIEGNYFLSIFSTQM